ncbi:hypothetical protein FSS13T_03000 [Flavobacterium saliperosum S13]|uniref:Uncharacterized protein n=1 Tax=Flavobacterium saliperosum S13 TaxID=1341155 RepID=A0ABP3A1F3_9FLAO|nr:hypothetical protein FSS13T_03000 [Flavobacterium saliperosum S13]
MLREVNQHNAHHKSKMSLITVRAFLFAPINTFFWVCKIK